MRPRKLFRDRVDAGRKLAAELVRLRREAPIVLGLPRGGVPVAFEIARELGAPLDVCVVRKIGAPMQPELGIGAVSEDNAIHVDRHVMTSVGVSDEELASLAQAKRAEVRERVRQLRLGAPPLEVRDRTVIVVDDGVATGGTARAAVQTLRARGAARVVFAVPVGARDTLRQLAQVADEVVCPHAEKTFFAVAPWYEDFSPTTDEAVTDLLARARADWQRRRDSDRARSPLAHDARVPIDGVRLEGRLTIPANARGLVIFAHGSGSSRFSPRSRFVARELHYEGLATLLLDLLTAEEEEVDARTGHLRFDIGLLASRLTAATDWAHAQREIDRLPIGYFGASTGAAAALVAAAARPLLVHAVVSRGGRPELADGALAGVRAPTLLLVGGADREVVESNRDVLSALGTEKLLEIIPGASHSFEEPGALEQVARAAARWLVHHLARHAIARAG